MGLNGWVVGNGVNEVNIPPLGGLTHYHITLLNYYFLSKGERLISPLPASYNIVVNKD